MKLVLLGILFTESYVRTIVFGGLIIAIIITLENNTSYHCIARHYKRYNDLA